MRLVNMDVDRLDSDRGCQLGPLSPGLNAICGPLGSGKSTLLRWLRALTADVNFVQEYVGGFQPTNSAHPSRLPASGTLELHNQGCQYRVVSDRNGRITFDAVRPSGATFGEERRELGLPAKHLTPLQRTAFVGLAELAAAGDTEPALEQLAQRLGIVDRVGSSDERRASLLASERDLVSQLQATEHLHATRESLLARTHQLELELETARRTPAADHASLTLEQRRLETKKAALENDLQNALRQTEELDREIAERRAELERFQTSPASVPIGNAYRVQLQQLDERLNRWRQTLRDLKTHRELTEHHATDARLDKQLGDQLSTREQSNPRSAMRLLESQILRARQQLDALVNRTSATLASEPGSEFSANNVYRDASGRTYVGPSSVGPRPTEIHFSDALRAMQSDLHEVCQQLTRREAAAASETLKQQAQQLQRCELELLQSVERLIEERGALLRKIAEDLHISVDQLTLAVGKWCQCHDHPHLHDWLLSEEHCTSHPSLAHANSHAPLTRQAILNTLDALERKQHNASQTSEDCRGQIREVDAQCHRLAEQLAAVKVRFESDIQRDLDSAKAELADWSSREQLQASLVKVRQQLRDWRPSAPSTSRFRAMTDLHIAALMGPCERVSRNVSTRPLRRYDLVDGIVTENHETVIQPEFARQVPSCIVHMAMRLAIGQYMAGLGEPVCLVFDEALDSVPAAIQQSAILHLATLAATQQQVILLTADDRVVQLVQANHGWIGYLSAVGALATPIDRDVNRHLTALANDHEYDKWYQPTLEPNVRRAAAVGDYYLNDRSYIEDLPSMDPTVAARCRAKGIDRIGDLLDVDPHWLHEQVRMEGVGYNAIVAWQAEARLLSSVPKLRPFDARVLVGAGVRTAAQLADMRPSQLLERVEQFLATDRGRRILSSGSSFELSRITAWIASAEGGKSRSARTSVVDDDEILDSESSSTRRNAPRAVGDGKSATANGRNLRRERETTRSNHSNTDINRQLDRSEDRDYVDEGGLYESARDHEGFPRRDGTASGSAPRTGEFRSRNGSAPRSSQAGSKRNKRTKRSGERSYPVISRGSESPRSWEERESQRDGRERRASEPDNRRDVDRRDVDRRDTDRRDTVQMRADTESRLKFYLDLSSPIVDAPSIGPSMASKLEQFRIVTVDQFLAANAESLADKLGQRRVDADTIRAWQEQARLVCRIPNLRGHDAQLLVACDLTSPEELATLNPASVLAQVLAVAQSTEGQRILRGSKEPDLQEVNDWIAWAASSRSLNAA